MNWYEEMLHANLRERLRVSRILHEADTGLQKLIIFENPTLGRVMALDGVIQTTEGDEYAYHEMLAHVPILAHGSVERVLVIGGGDGGCLEEVLKHPVKRAVMVEIDRAVVEMSREHLPMICGDAFDDSRAEIIFDDGAKFVRDTDERFDVIIVDSPDPVGPAEVLFGEEFYAACRARLTPGGIVVAQNGVPFLQPDELRNTRRRLSSLFADVAFYVTVVPTYHGGFMALAWATDEPAHRAVTSDALDERFRAAGIATRYYNPSVHSAAFALPNFIRDLLAH